MVNRIYLHDSAEHWRIQRDQFTSRRSSRRRADEEFAHHLLTFHEMYCQEPVCVENKSSTSATLASKPALHVRLTPMVRASSLSMMPNKETLMKVIKKEIIEEPQPSEELGYQTYTVKEGALEEDWTEDSDGGQDSLTEPKSEQPEAYLGKEEELGDGWTEDSGATGVCGEAQSEDAVKRRYYSLQEEEFADGLSEESGTTEDFEEAQLHNDNTTEMEKELSEQADYEINCVTEERLDSDCTEDYCGDLQMKLQGGHTNLEKSHLSMISTPQISSVGQHSPSQGGNTNLEKSHLSMVSAPQISSVEVHHLGQHSPSPAELRTQSDSSERESEYWSSHTTNHRTCGQELSIA